MSTTNILDLNNRIDELEKNSGGGGSADSAKRSDIATEFSTETSYTAGNFVYYDGKLYQFNADHSAGAWDPTDVVESNVTDQIVSNKAAVDELDVTLDNIGTYYESEVPAGTDSEIIAHLILPAGKYFVVGQTGIANATVTSLFTIHTRGTDGVNYARAMYTGKEFNLSAIVELANSTDIYFEYAGGSSTTTTTTGTVKAIRIK